MRIFAIAQRSFGQNRRAAAAAWLRRPQSGGAGYAAEPGGVLGIVRCHKPKRPAGQLPPQGGRCRRCAAPQSAGIIRWIRGHRDPAGVIFAAARSRDGPPMSIILMICPRPVPAATVRAKGKGCRPPDRSAGSRAPQALPRWARERRSAKIPAATLGCRVLTCPSENLRRGGVFVLSPSPPAPASRSAAGRCRSDNKLSRLSARACASSTSPACQRPTAGPSYLRSDFQSWRPPILSV